MKFLTIAITALFLSNVGTVSANEKESTKPQAIKVDNSCLEEAKTASCGDEKVGTGLLKCLHKYKKEHKDFKFSDGCKDSLKSLHELHKEKKEAKENNKK